MGRLAGRAELSTTVPGPDDDAVARPPHPAAGRRGSRWARLVGIGAVLLLVAIVFGVTTASVQQSLGPHVARYDVTTDDLVTVDLGPLGTIEIESPLPATLGVRVVVQEIPRDVTAVDPARTVQALGQDLQSYVQFFTGPRATIADAARALVGDAVRRSVLCLIVLVAVAVGVRALLGRSRRRELGAALTPHRAEAGRGAAIAVVVGTLCVSSMAGAVDEAPAGRPSAVFDGTPLEGARITGRLAGVVDTYGSMVVEAYQANEAFYAAAQANVAAAWDQRAQAIAAREEAEARLDELGDPFIRPTEAPDDGADGEGGAGGGDAEGEGDVDPGDAGTEAEAEDDRDARRVADTEPVDPTVIVLVSDLHCNVGMARIIGTVAERSGADLVLNAGDTTVNGTSVEKYCVTAFGEAVPDGVPKVVADGNHDSLLTAEHEREAGWTVLDGQVIEAAGVRILGDRDPNQTQVGGGTNLVSDETVAEAGERLAEVACDHGAVDILLIHTPRVGDAAMESGCVPVQLSGHEHRRTGPVQVGEGMRYVSSTTAGATSGGATIGPLNGVASLTVLRFDPEERRMIDLQVVQVAPDGSATVGPREPFGVPEPVDDDAAGGESGAGPDGGTGDGGTGDGDGESTGDDGGADDGGTDGDPADGVGIPPGIPRSDRSDENPPTDEEATGDATATDGATTTEGAARTAPAPALAPGSALAPAADPTTEPAAG